MRLWATTASCLAHLSPDGISPKRAPQAARPRQPTKPRIPLIFNVDDVGTIAPRLCRTQAIPIYPTPLHQFQRRAIDGTAKAAATRGPASSAPTSRLGDARGGSATIPARRDAPPPLYRVIEPPRTSAGLDVPGCGTPERQNTHSRGACTRVDVEDTQSLRPHRAWTVVVSPDLVGHVHG